MTNSLEKILTDTIVESKQSIGKAVDWAMTQVPDICEQYLRIELIKSCATAIYFILAGIALYKAGHYCFRQAKKTKEEGLYVAGVFAFIFGALASIPFFAYAMNAATIYFAPKVYLVEFAAKLIK